MGALVVAAIATEAGLRGMYRGKFSDRHAQPVQPWKKDSGHRLTDSMMVTWGLADAPTLPIEPPAGEFLVLDKVRQEVAYFEWPSWMDSGRVHQMIEGHFGVQALRLFDRVWVV